MPSKTNDFAFSNKESSRIANSAEWVSTNHNNKWRFSSSPQSTLSKNKFVINSTAQLCYQNVSVFHDK
jgi:hypothetical protein